MDMDYTGRASRVRAGVARSVCSGVEAHQWEDGSFQGHFGERVGK